MKTNGVVRMMAAALCLAVILLSHAQLAVAQSETTAFPSPVAYGEASPTTPEYSLADYSTASYVAPCTDLASCIDAEYCEDDCRKPFFYASVEASALKYSVQTGGIITLSFSDTTAPGVSTVAYVDGRGDKNWAYTPRGIFGMNLTEHFGVAFRGWLMDDAQQRIPPHANPNIPSTGDNFARITNYTTVEMYTFDVVGTTNFQIGKTKFDLECGARHGRIDTYAQIHAFGVFTTGNFVNVFLANGFSFDGTGVTGAINVRRQVGESNLFLVGRIGGAYLWGHTDSFGRSSGTVASSPSAPLVGAATVSRNNADAATSIWEAQFGFQWEFLLSDSGSSAFFKVGAEWADWEVNAPPTGGAGFGGTVGEITTNSFASAGIGEASMYGITISTGFTW